MCARVQLSRLQARQSEADFRMISHRLEDNCRAERLRAHKLQDERDMAIAELASVCACARLTHGRQTPTARADEHFPTAL